MTIDENFSSHARKRKTKMVLDMFSRPPSAREAQPLEIALPPPFDEGGAIIALNPT